MLVKAHMDVYDELRPPSLPNTIGRLVYVLHCMMEPEHRCFGSTSVQMPSDAFTCA